MNKGYAATIDEGQTLPSGRRVFGCRLFVCIDSERVGVAKQRIGRLGRLRKEDWHWKLTKLLRPSIIEASKLPGAHSVLPTC